MECPDCRARVMERVSFGWQCACGAVQYEAGALRAAAHVNAMRLVARSGFAAAMEEPAPRYRRRGTNPEVSTFA